LKFYNELRSGNLAITDAGRASRAIQGSKEPRQGILRFGFNCKGNDRFAVPPAIGKTLLQLDRIDACRSLDQRIRARQRMPRSERYADTVARQCGGDASLQGLVRRCIDA
jgi:hypothetical protein